MDKRLLEVNEAAELLRIGRSVTYRLIMSGDLESVRIGGRRLVPVAAIDTYIESLRGAQTGSAA